MTPNRSAGRIEDELWDAFLVKCRDEGLSNTDGMRRMIRTWTGMPEPVALDGETGSAVEEFQWFRSLSGRGRGRPHGPRAPTRTGCRTRGA